MRELDFYKSSRSVQERFVASVGGAGAPLPMLRQQTLPLESLLWTGVSGVGALAILALWELGYGSLDSSLAVHSTPMVVPYVLFLGVCAFGALRAATLANEVRQLPFRPGQYLFPSGLVEVTGSKLNVFPIEDLSAVEGPDAQNRVRLVFAAGRAFTFPVKDAPAAAGLKAAVQEAKAAVKAAEASGDRAALIPLDPLADPGYASPFSPKTPIVKRAPLWARYGLLWAALAGLVLGPLLFQVRNGYSDGRMLRAAERLRTSAAYKSYLVRGGTEANVGQVLLPRAELADATKQRSVEAIRSFAKEHPKSQIQAEVSAAMRAALLVELDKTKTAGTVTALQQFKDRYPEHPLIAQEIGQAVHAVYADALDKYRRVSSERDKGIVPFFERLFAFCERKGPRVEVRFHRKASQSMERADGLVKKNPYYTGPPSLPSRYFDETHVRGWEAEVGKALIERFADVFPKDVLYLEQGAPIGEADTLPAVTVPTVLVEYALEMSAAAYLSYRPRGVYVGLGLTAEPSFRIPDDAKPLRYKFSAWRPPDLNPKKLEPPYEQNVYEAMGLAAYTQLSKGYLGFFFKPAEAKPAEAQPAEAKPAEAKPEP
jgi:hypothetical protein